MDAALATAYASGLVARGLVTLPRPVQRALAGPVPEVASGLAPEAWLLARAGAVAERLSHGRPAPSVEQGRVLAEAQSRFLVRPARRPVSTEDMDLDGVPGRLYTPVDAASGVLVFFHGGGWVNRSMDSHDGAVQALADLSGVRIVSVDYRRAPEDPFPAAADDALIAFRSICRHFRDECVAVGGDSAGGNLAASVCVTARDRGERVPDFQWLLYPATDASRRYASTTTFSTGFFLTEAAMDRYTALYMGGHETDPRASPLLADATGLPPAYVATALADPLRDEGEAYAEKLRAAGVPAVTQRFGLLHGFLNATAGRAARDAVAVTAGALRAGLA